MEAEQNMNEDLVDFGFDQVPRDAKSGLVGEVFSDVAGRYDLMNDLMSFGVHRLWKAAFIDRLKPRAGMALLDVAGGTGDIVRAFCERISASQPAEKPKSDLGPTVRTASRAIVCDINFEMTVAGRDRAIDRPLNLKGAPTIEWVCGNAEALPVEDVTMDAVTIAFGLRNVTNRTLALAEAYRALKPGGHYLILEFSTVNEPLMARLYDRYSFSILPEIGALIARNRDAYRYLAESIRKFPRPNVLQTEMEAAGFGRVSYQLLSGGIAAIHSGWRI